MKLIIYTLTAEGAIPEYVIDGGYLVWGSGGVSPQDYDFVGVAKDEAEQTGFASESALLTYAKSKWLEYTDSLTKESIPIENVVASIWAKVEGV